MSAARTPEGFAAWLEEQVLDVPDRAAYLERLGAERWRRWRSARTHAGRSGGWGTDTLQACGHRPSREVPDYTPQELMRRV